VITESREAGSRECATEERRRAKEAIAWQAFMTEWAFNVCCGSGCTTA